MEELLKCSVLLGFAVKNLQEIKGIYEINIDHNTGMPRIAVCEELFENININSICVTRKHDDYFQEKHKILHGVIFVTYADKEKIHVMADTDKAKMNKFETIVSQKESA